MRQFFGWLGAALLVGWCVWWGVSLQQGHLLWVEQSFIQIPAFGIDFTRNTETPVRIWLTGENAYADKELLFAYPPVVARVFAWVKLFTPSQALTIWICTLGSLAVLAAIWAARWRRELGLTVIPASMAIAMVVFSAPVLFAMERANYDMLIVPLLVLGLVIARQTFAEAVLVGAFFIALAIWLKLYPILLLIGLVAARRWRLTIWTVVWVGLIALWDVAELYQFKLNTDLHVARAKFVAGLGGFEPLRWNHSLSLSWPALFDGSPLAQVNGSMGAIAVIGALIGWVAYECWRSKVSDALLAPMLLWIIAAATFLPPVSNDYNLLPLMVAVVALWNGRHVGNWLTLIAVFICVQPVGTRLDGEAMFAYKLISLLGVAWLVIQALRRGPAAPQQEAR